MNSLEANIRSSQSIGDIKKIRNSGFVPGILFDYLGSYNFAIWISSISSLWGAIIVLMLRKTDKLIVQYSPN